VRVLVVDDDNVGGPALAELLTRRGHPAEWVRDGRAALGRLRLYLPDVVVLDLMMAGMPGCELLRAMRAEPAWAGIPVLVVSAAGEEDLARVPEGVEVMRKPVEPEDLVAAVARLRGLPVGERQA
jgi:CheY-like chemotaxis protein